MAKSSEVKLSKIKAGDTLYQVKAVWKGGKQVHKLTPRVVASVGRKWITLKESWLSRISVASLRSETYGSQWYRSVEEYQEQERKDKLRNEVAAACSAYKTHHLTADQLQAILDIARGGK